ncbi:MAG: tRNA (guanosine(46)-N7)-methyltransferase TrmB [Oscillospiraceae bacterium]|nr:tRNA (guanosine(46)-N7)-methyltransferase TrmB [Oscillospiraceae bacterium]
MRNKKNLIPRMEKCAAVQVFDPGALRGRWAGLLPGCRQVRAEMGCGKGQFTAGVALQEPDILLVALEKVPNAMVTAMERAMAGDIRNVRFIDTDVAVLPEIFAPGEVSVIYINFPDPWPRKKEAKHRLTAPSFLAMYWDILPVGGRIEYKTDQPWLFDWSLEQFAYMGYALSEITRDLHGNGVTGIMTNYETRFCEQGVPIHRCVATKTEDRPATPVPEKKARPVPGEDAAGQPLP